MNEQQYNELIEFEKSKSESGDFGDLWALGINFANAAEQNSQYKEELANKAIYYLERFVDGVLQTRNYQVQNDEWLYVALLLCGNSSLSLGQSDRAIAYYSMAGAYAEDRNEHLYAMTLVHKTNGNYKELINLTTKMMQVGRDIPTKYSMAVNQDIYSNSKNRVIHELHKEALYLLLNNAPKKKDFEFKFNEGANKRLFIVDDFYENPDEIREFALTKVEYQEDLRFYKGKRSLQKFIPPGIKERFETIIGEKIHVFEEHAMNGCFQITKSTDVQVYHFDEQKWAAIIYLTPNAPHISGTRLHRSKITGSRDSRDPNVNAAFNGDFYDSTRFDTIDTAGNIYNRLIIMDARSIHSAGNYFGNTDDTGRLIHLFFFD